MSFKEELEALNKWKQSKEIIEIEDNGGIFTARIIEVKDDSVKYERFRNLELILLEIKGITQQPSSEIVTTLISNISIIELSEEERRIRKYCITKFEEQKQKKPKKKRKRR